MFNLVLHDVGEEFCLEGLGVRYSLGLLGLQGAGFEAQEFTWSFFKECHWPLEGIVVIVSSSNYESPKSLGVYQIY